jgi:hypothetical protein
MRLFLRLTLIGLLINGMVALWPGWRVGCFYPVLFFIAMFLVGGVLERCRIQTVLARFEANRQQMTDDEFLRGADAEPEFAPFYLAARQIMAELCGVQPEMIHPDDTLQSLMYLQWDGSYMEDFLFPLQDQFGVKLLRIEVPPDARFPPSDRLPFGVFVKGLASYCQPRVELCR